MSFINTLLNTTRNLNRRVYLQYELELAEFDAIEFEKVSIRLLESYRWQQTYWVNPLLCAHAQNNVDNGNLPGKSAAILHPKSPI